MDGNHFAKRSHAGNWLAEVGECWPRGRIDHHREAAALGRFWDYMMALIPFEKPS